ncbi:protein usg [Sandaracinobacter neustonicus]|uniref:Protein usg n=1 Tax=Sandaracinobacter neustonicus TaxID=1715348 RepID=A0A501XCZ4_9SPHN|nr:protein usg [Sandaracinobacter neustonicus]TPE58488.1 protein usg [Sandaracinobacter neustonicus]
MRSIDDGFRLQMSGYGLLTAEISYWMPDHPSLLQQYIWQSWDLAPSFPELARFLEHWRREIEATIHAIRVAHRDLISPAEFRAVDGVLTLH